MQFQNPVSNFEWTHKGRMDKLKAIKTVVPDKNPSCLLSDTGIVCIYISITRFSQMEFPTLINWSSPFPF